MYEVTRIGRFWGCKYQVQRLSKRESCGLVEKDRGFLVEAKDPLRASSQTEKMIQIMDWKSTIELMGKLVF